MPQSYHNSISFTIEYSEYTKRHSQYVLRLYLWSKPLILGKKGVSQKEMQEINDTVESLFPQAAPTPPPRQKIAKLRGKSRKNSAR